MDSNNCPPMVQKYQCQYCSHKNYVDCFESVESTWDNRCVNFCIDQLFDIDIRAFLGLHYLDNPSVFNAIKMKIFYCPNAGILRHKYKNPLWKYLDKHGNTLVKGIRIDCNKIFFYIFYGDVMDKIDCAEITQNEIDDLK